MKTHHTVSIGELTRDLPIVSVAPNVNIAFLKLYGDPELTEAVAEALVSHLQEDAEMILAPESGGILLAHLISVKSGLPYALARKKRRPNMRDPAIVEVTSIGTKGVQQLFVDDEDKARLSEKRVVLVDEVISSGATIRAVEDLAAQCGSRVVQRMTVATEGDEQSEVTKLMHLPLFLETCAGSDH